MARLEETVLDAISYGIDRSGPVPLYYQLSQRLEQAIRDETLPPGSRLENEIALGERLGLSRPTVRRAIQDLVDKGLLVRRRGIGTQVVQGTVTRNLELSSLFNDLQDTGFKPDTILLSADIEPASAEIAEALGVDEGSQTLHLRRVRRANGVPLAVLDNTLPADLIGLETEMLTDHGLYQLLRARGVTIRVAKQRISAGAADAEEARLLDLKKGAPVITMTRTAFDNSGRAIETGHHRYRPDMYAFEVTLVDK